MSPALALAATVALIAIATAIGLVWRARLGRIRSTTAERVTVADLDVAAALGPRMTLVQFSTEFCAPCRSTHRVLAQLADRTEGVAHLDIDLTHRTDLANRFNVTQTPTTLVLDSGGVVRARIGGAPRVDELSALIHEVLIHEVLIHEVLIHEVLEDTNVGLVK